MNVKAKKLLSLVLAFVMVMGMFPATVFATNEAGRFADVRDSDWYADAVRYVSDNGLMVGVDENHFAPGGLTTRGMVVTVLHRMEGAPSAEATGFTDVESGMWYTEAVLWAQANGIVEGFGDGTFQPNASMTREQMMAVFYRYSQHKGYDVSDTMSLGIFADSIKIQSYAEDAMAWAVAVGLIKGFPDGTIRPQADSNRAQLATVLMRFSQTLGSEADRDEDGISDAVEDFFGTSVESDDTDSDGLSDYFEIYFTDTDPTLADTDADGILDGDEDSDDDGLSNLEEQELGTVGNNSDTDGDGLTDGMEVMVLGTNPTKNDSDNDGLADDEEIILGLDPLNPMSDGMTLDSERTFAQVTDSSIMDEALQNSDNWLVPSISGEVSGVINHNIQMNDASIYAFESNRSVQSDIIDVYTEYDTPLTLSFSYDQGYTGDIVNLNIMTYAEGCLTPIDTTIDESVGTISAEIYESGTYFVLDLDEFLKGLGIDVLSSISYETEEASPAEENETLSTTETSIFAAETVATPASFGATGKADIVFVIDVTGSMSGGIDGVKNNINEFAAALVNDYNIDANFALVEYQDITYDGEGSTILHKNMSSNWFTSVESYIDEVNSLRLGDGGDWEETPIDALELARSLDWRGEATKFVVLVTDAGYKTNNSYGISDMDEMAQRLHDSGVITSVIAETDDTYAALTETTGGLYGFIYDDFSDILLQLANMVGTETNSSGEWVFLDDFQAVKLSDILEHAESNDTDNDGYSDAMELGESKTVLMLMYINALLNKHSIPTECYTGKLTLDVWEYVSNPTLLDTDYDGIPDGTKDYDGSNVAEPDEYPRRIDSFSWLDIFGKYDGNRFRGEVTNNDYTIDLSFKVDYSLFFNDLSAYNRELAKLGIIYSIGAYHSNIDINYGVDFTGDDATMMMNYGMKNVTTVKLADYYVDDDLSEITIGHREVTYQGVTRDIIFIAVRGTDATIEEWSSNFDVGANTTDYWDVANPHWRNKDHHKGFDVAANRLDEFIKDYISNLDGNTSKVLYFTGHSRGAAIANILASMYVDAGYSTVGYTFATPSTTLDKNVSSYKTIFNIVNSDDLVPCLPLEKWGYGKYGKTYSVSIEKSYEDTFGGYDEGTWEAMFNCDYNYNGNLSDTLNAFSNVIGGRDEIYQFTGEDDTFYTYKTKYDTESEARKAALDQQDKYGDRISKFCNFYTVEVDPLIGGVYYQVRVEQMPAALMMILTDVVGTRQHTRNSAGEDEMVDYSQRGAGEDSFVGNDISFYVAKKYEKAKSEFVWSGSDSAADIAMTLRMGGMLHSHMPGTYYLIVEDGKSLLP